MKTIPQLSLVFGSFERLISRDEAAEILRVTRQHFAEQGLRFRQDRRNVYPLGGLFLYTMIG